jgi:hypothetical protein
VEGSDHGAYFNVLSLHLLGGSERNYKNLCQGSGSPTDVPDEQLPNAEQKIYLLIELDL